MVDDYLEEVLTSWASASKNLSSAFWTTFYPEFAIAAATFSNISVEPPDGNTQDDDLMESLLEVRDSNPIDRETAKFIDYIAYADGKKTSMTDLLLMLEGSRKGCRVCLIG